MTELHTVGWNLQEKEWLTGALGAAEEKATELNKWRDLPWKWEQKATAKSLRARIAVCNERIGEDGVKRLADYAAEHLWKKAAEIVLPNKNPYGRAAYLDFDHILDHAWQLRGMVDLPCGPGAWFYQVTGIAEVNDFMTRAFMSDAAREKMKEYRRMARSALFTHEFPRNKEGLVELVVQHLPSGLRARFTVESPGFGSVFSKSHVVPSINPVDPGTLDVLTDYAGLGIGRQIYGVAHRLIPSVRWQRVETNAFSEPLREKLHAKNPYTWEAKCAWCEDKRMKLGVLSWKEADGAFFAAHP